MCNKGCIGSMRGEGGVKKVVVEGMAVVGWLGLGEAGVEKGKCRFSVLWCPLGFSV